MASRFNVHLKDFRATNLAAKDRNGLSDPYFKGDFDKFKVINNINLLHFFHYTKFY
jgi:hypothetical protein